MTPFLVFYLPLQNPSFLLYNPMCSLCPGCWPLRPAPIGPLVLWFLPGPAKGRPCQKAGTQEDSVGRLWSCSSPLGHHRLPAATSWRPQLLLGADFLGDILLSQAAAGTGGILTDARSSDLVEWLSSLNHLILEVVRTPNDSFSQMTPMLFMGSLRPSLTYLSIVPLFNSPG